MNLFNFFKNMFGSCGCGSSSKEEKKEQYKCQSCGSVSDKDGECCGAPKEKVCSCSSGKYAKDCCEA